MRLMKKAIGLLLTAVMAVGMVATVSAENKAVEVEKHTFEAYKVFKGTQAEGKEQLGDLDWGGGVDPDKMLYELKNDATLATIMANCKTAQDVAEALKDVEDKSAVANAFAIVASKCIVPGTGTTCVNHETTLEPGYYVVIDTTDVEGKADAKNAALLQLTNKKTFDIESKADVPSGEKEVANQNDSYPDASTWSDAADYDIGDDVPFRVKATLPSNLAEYETYKLELIDTLSNGLTLNEDSLYVTLDGQNITGSTGYTKTTSATGFTITFSDIKKLGAKAGDVVMVEYTAKLNDQAEIGKVGNTNKFKVRFSNNPKDDGEGETPEKKVIVFTYKLVTDKVNNKQEALAGAGFTLYKWYYDENAEAKGSWKAVGAEVKGEQMTTFTWKGLDAGKYKLEETTIPAGYNKMKDIEFEIKATLGKDASTGEPTIIDLTATDKDGAVTFDKDESEGKIHTKVINQEGSTLPETGGMGTTIFYILGSLLALGAGVLLVARKRMNA